MLIAEVRTFLKNSGNLLHDRHKNSEIALEIAEIIEVEVGNHHLEIEILVFHRDRKIISILKVATLTSIISAIFKSNFIILVPIM